MPAPSGRDVLRRGKPARMGSLVGLGLGSALAMATAVVMGSALADPLLLRCRLGDGPWQTCSMDIDRPGERWALQVAGRRIEFRHDGSGTVTMQDPASPSPASGGPAGPWVPVATTWIAGPALCWNGVCAQGDIPLD